LSLSYYHPKAGAAPGAAASAPHTINAANIIKIAIISISNSSHHRHMVHGIAVIVKRFVAAASIIFGGSLGVVRVTY
jgi:hypothetical protein